MTEQYRQITLENYLRGSKVPNLHIGPTLDRALNRKRDAIQTIVCTVAQNYDLIPEELRGPSRQKNIVEARQIATYFLYTHTGLSFRGAALSLGRNDHTTSINAIQNVERKMEEDPDFKSRIEEMSAHFSDNLDRV